MQSHEAMKRPGEQALDCKTLGLIKSGRGYEVLKFVDMTKKLRYLATSQDTPQFIIVHCGRNDWGHII